jgi:hypothetical protein
MPSLLPLRPRPGPRREGARAPLSVVNRADQASGLCFHIATYASPSAIVLFSTRHYGAREEGAKPSDPVIYRTRREVR